MLNWREVPFIRILIPFIIGVYTSIYLDENISFGNYLILGLFLFIIYSALIRTRFSLAWLNGILISSFFFLFAYQLSFYHNDLNLKDHFRKNILDENLVIGIVDNAPSISERSIQVNLKVEQIGEDFSSLESASGTLMVRLRNDSINQNIKYGDLLVIKSGIKLVSPNLNPEAFDFQKYLNYKNIHYQAFVKNENWSRLGGDCANPVLSLAYQTRAKLINSLRRNIKSKNEFAVASALILGYKKELSSEVKNAYSKTGAMHVLAVSGLHVGLIWAILAFFLNWIKWRSLIWKWVKAGIIILGLWSFALLTGAAPSVLRAATMFSFLLIGNTLSRNTNIYNTIAASAFCLLLFNPYLILEVGFQLSYLAVIGIVYFYQKIYNLWYIENKVGDYIWKLTAIALAAQALTFPLTMFYFHQFPIYFWLSGLVVVPFAFIILSLGIGLLFFDWLIPFISPILAKALFLVIWLMNAFISLVEQLPAGVFEKIWLEPYSFWFLFLMIICSILAINTKKAKWIISGFAFLLVVSGMNAFSSFKQRQQKAIVFYHLPQKSYIEFIDGRKAIALSDPEIKEGSIKYANQNFHLKHGITDLESFLFGMQITDSGSWFLKGDFVQFYDKRIAFVDKLPKQPLLGKIKVDFIVFRKWTNSSIAETMQFFEFDKVVFDGALNQRKRIELKRECQSLQVSFHDVNQEGAFVLEF